MSDEIVITDTEKRRITIDIQIGYNDKQFNHISISRELKGLHREYDVISLSIDELKKICKEVSKIVID